MSATTIETQSAVYRSTASKRFRRGLGNLLNNCFLVFVIFLILAPIIWLVQMSVRTDIAIFEMPPDYSQGWTLQNFVDLLQGGFGRNLLNSLIVSTVTSGISLLIGVPAAYALSRYAFKREKLLTFWILSARLALPIGFALPLFNMFLQVGWTNSYQAIIIVYLTFATPLVIWVMRPFLDSIPNDLEESAAVDGASPWQAFTQIVLPLSAPGLVSVGVLTFIMTWIEFFYALVFTRGDMMTAPVGVVNFLQYAGWEWGKITTAGVLIMLPVIIFSVLTNKYLISGLTAGAIKG
jgi:multiple sugar transport system permease protein